MMVPRAFAATSPPRSSPVRSYDEKKDFSVRTRSVHKSRPPSPAQTSRQDSPKPASAASTTPSSNASRSQLKPADAAVRVPQRPQQTPLQIPPKRESVQDLLRATAIPIKRKPKKRPSQRLPDGDHVANFSSWLQDDLKTTGGSASSSYGAQFDGLFGSIDGLVDGQMFLGSNGLDSSIMRARSKSTESIPSLASPDDSSIGGNSSISPFASRSNSDRRIRPIASSEDCALQHPLMPSEEEEDGSITPELVMSPARRRQQNNASRRPSSFKSTLTASLKAIKSAAQSVSNYATPFNEADMFSSPFDIRPSLTDDRRPPPSSEVPSPALRRYLNPNISAPPDSPAQLHFWTEHRSTKSNSPITSAKPSPPATEPAEDGFRPRPKKKQTPKLTTDTTRLPPVVPLATCRPPIVRTEHASSPPIWLAPDGSPINKQTADPLLSEPGTSALLKQREPRENRDFLRVFVCEMEMKRAGKLKSTALGHARMWLPPVSEARGGRGGSGRRAIEGARGGERWGVWVPPETEEDTGALVEEEGEEMRQATEMALGRVVR